MITNPENTDRRARTVEAVTEADRELLMLLGSVGIRMSEIVTGLFEDSLSCDEQLAFEEQLTELAEGFRQRVLRTPLVIDGEAT
jgi:hypothetical protein